MRRRISAGLRVRDARDGEAPARRLEDRRQHPDRGRLAGAVRPEHAEDLAGLRLEAEILDGDERAVALLDASRLDRCAHAPRRKETSSLRSLPPLTVCSSTVPIPRT